MKILLEDWLSSKCQLTQVWMDMLSDMLRNL